jgi:hypothetical protein
MQPDTPYAKSGDVNIAYQVFGEGPLNVVFAPPNISNVERWWEEPDARVVGCFASRTMPGW